MKTSTKPTRRKTTPTKLTANGTCNRCGTTSLTVPFGPLKDFDPVLSRYYESGGQ